jgi:MFS family permease
LLRHGRALIGARAVQGVGAALLVPGSLSLISATFRRTSAARPSAPGRPSAASPRRSGRCSAAG